MNNMEPTPKFSGFKLTAVNTLVATLAGIISIMGGLYSLKNSIFQTQQGEGVLAGIVRDEAIARPLKEASVEISNISNFVVSTLYTDQGGRYETGKLKEGPYVVKVSAVRHVSQVKTVTVFRNQTATVHFDLVPVAAEEKESSVARPEFQPAPAYIPPPPPAPVARQVYQPETQAPFYNSREAEQAYYHPQVHNYPGGPAYPAAQRPAAGSAVAQTIVQTGLELLGNYAAQKNKSQPTAKTSQNSQRANTNESSQNSYPKENP